MVDAGTDSLYTVDPATGAATLVGVLGTNEPSGLASHAGTLYMVDLGTDSLYTVDPATGDATLVGVLGTNAAPGTGEPRRDALHGRCVHGQSVHCRSGYGRRDACGSARYNLGPVGWRAATERSTWSI